MSAKATYRMCLIFCDMIKLKVFCIWLELMFKEFSKFVNYNTKKETLKQQITKEE